MKLEPIDTSTTAGKARVMQLAAEGRRVAARWRHCDADAWFGRDRPEWAWATLDYAIIAQPVGPDEVWLFIAQDGEATLEKRDVRGKRPDETAVRYRRVEE